MNGPDIEVISAGYASMNKGFDVTTLAGALLQNTNLLPVNNDTMGGDPDPGQTKYFTIVYKPRSGELTGQTLAQGCQESYILTISV